jgi:hypothetical protein
MLYHESHNEPVFEGDWTSFHFGEFYKVKTDSYKYSIYAQVIEVETNNVTGDFFVNGTMSPAILN